MTGLRSELWRTTTRPKRPLTAKTLADLLVTAALELADVRNLAVHLAAFSTDDRLAAERWARAKVATRGEHIPPMPKCIAALYRRLALTAGTQRPPVDLADTQHTGERP